MRDLRIARPLPNPCTPLILWPRPPLCFLWPPPIFEGHRPPPPKITNSECINTFKSDRNSFSKLSIQWIPCISQNRVKRYKSYKLLPLLGSQSKVDCLPFLPSKWLTAPRFWRSPPLLCASVWQWVAIQYLSAGLDKSGVRMPGTTRKRLWATRVRGLVAQRTTKIV